MMPFLVFYAIVEQRKDINVPKLCISNFNMKNSSILTQAI